MYRTIDSRFWPDPKVRELPPLGRYLFLYFLTNPHSHVSGIYYVPRPIILHETSLTRQQLDTLCDTLSSLGLVRFSPETETIWVVNMFGYQGRGRKNLRSAALQLESLHKSCLIQDFLHRYPGVEAELTDTLSDTLSDTPTVPATPDQDQDQDQEKEQEQEREGEERPPPAEPFEPADGENPDGPSRVTVPDDLRIVIERTWIPVPSNIETAVQIWIANFDPAWVHMAIERAAENGKAKPAYIGAILRGWKDEGGPPMQAVAASKRKAKADDPEYQRRVAEERARAFGDV